jgi:RNA recognition motif-containing protein
MTKYVYVGNLPHDATAEAVRSAFERDGRTVSDISLVRNPKTGRPRGFGFVEMESEEAAAAAIQALEGAELGGRPLKLGQAQERPEFQVRNDPEGPRRGGGRRRR